MIRFRDCVVVWGLSSVVIYLFFIWPTWRGILYQSECDGHRPSHKPKGNTTQPFKRALLTFLEREQRSEWTTVMNLNNRKTVQQRLSVSACRGCRAAKIQDLQPLVKRHSGCLCVDSVDSVEWRFNDALGFAALQLSLAACKPDQLSVGTSTRSTKALVPSTGH